jgi:hypothetical protein
MRLALGTLVQQQLLRRHASFLAHGLGDVIAPGGRREYAFERVTTAAVRMRGGSDNVNRRCASLQLRPFLCTHPPLVTVTAESGAMERWSFVEDTSGAWFWRRHGGKRARRSLRRFSTILAAMDDAERHGLMPGKSRLGPIIRHRLLWSGCITLLLSNALSMTGWCGQAAAAF